MAFWLDSVDSGGQKAIIGRFIQFQMPGVGGDPLSANTGLWQVKLVK